MLRTKESSLAEYKAWLKERWSPLVALIPEEEAEEYCRDGFNKDLKDIFLCERRVKGLNKGLGGVFVVMKRSFCCSRADCSLICGDNILCSPD